MLLSAGHRGIIQTSRYKSDRHILSFASFLLDFLVVSEIILIFAPSNNSFMSYTKEPIIIDNPSKELLEVVKNLKERKRSQLEKLRSMKPEDFSCRIILK